MRLVYWFIFRPITLGIRCIIINDGKVLLIKHSYISEWYFPGGHVEKRENYYEAALREVKEELSIDLKSKPYLLGLYASFREYKNCHTVVLVFHEENVHLKVDGYEVENAKWYGLDNLPEDISPATKRRLEEYINKTPVSLSW